MNSSYFSSKYRINEEQVRAMVPQYLTAEQAKTIINGPDA